MKFLLALSILLFTSTKCNDEMLTRYSYSDGNQNRYSLNDHTLHYRPIKKEESSSGTYDGGEAKQVELSKEQREELIAVFQKVIDVGAQNIPRQMGSSQLSIIGEDKTERYILRYRSRAQTEINTVLKKLLEL